MSQIEISRPQTLDYEFQCFYDKSSPVPDLVQEYGTDNEKNFGHIDLEKVKIFKLIGDHKEFSVDLETGEMDLNGMSVSFDLGVKILEDGTPIKLIPKKYELVYFRRVRNDFNGGGCVGTKILYCIGWQTFIDGENFQRLAFIDNGGKILMSNKK